MSLTSLQKELREEPTYSMRGAARYLRIPSNTLQAWVRGRDYGDNYREKPFQPLIKLAQSEPPKLSFNNLIEVHVLRALRVEHKLDIKTIRKAIDYTANKLNLSRPLLYGKFKTDNLDLYVQDRGDLIVVSQEGQLAIQETLKQYLERIEFDDEGQPVRFFPFTKDEDPTSPKTIVIDPGISFGRPVIAQRGVPVEMIVSRRQAGESIQDLAYDYNCNEDLVKTAIDWQGSLAA